MSFLEQGGPHEVKQVGHDQYTLSVKIPEDEDGRVARECTNHSCSPAYFKVRLGTGLTAQKEAYCPYCRTGADPQDFATKRQREYVNDIAQEEVAKAAERMIRDTLGFSHTNKRRLVDGLLKVDMEMKSQPRASVPKPYEEVLKRDVVCPHCGLDHAVFGFAFWCPDCGRDIFTTHLRTEIEVVEKILGDVERREKELGRRVAVYDIGNALEDLVSIFEATLRIEIRRFRASKNETQEQIDDLLRKIGTRLQSIDFASTIIAGNCDGIILFEGDLLSKQSELNQVFQKRHPITHNLGIVDRKYLERVRSFEEEGKEVRLTKAEVVNAAKLVLAVLSALHEKLAVGR